MNEAKIEKEGIRTMVGQKRKMLSLTTRHWRCYNPSEYAGPVDMQREFQPASVAFVSLHLWNVGYPGGPSYPTDRFAMWMCTPEDTVIANQIVDEIIAPCLMAARGAGLTVFHAQPYIVADKYPISNLEWQPTDIPAHLRKKWRPAGTAADDEEVTARFGDPGAWSDPIPGWPLERAELVHGPGHRKWEGVAQLDIHESCKPLEGEYVVKTTMQLDGLLRKLGIVNLVYVGFTAQGCLLHTEGGIGPMSERGYRCMLIREGTHGVESAESRKERWMTRAAIFSVEQRYGLTIGAADFIRACEAVSEG